MNFSSGDRNLFNSIKLILSASVVLGLAGMGSSTGAARPDSGALWRPRFATPAIVALDSEANRQFIAEVRAPASAKHWTATIANDLKSWPCQVVAATYSTINRGTEPGWQVKVSVPAKASPELFDLTVSSSECVSTQNQCVSISPAF